MHRRVLLLALVLVYYGVATYGLALYDAGLMVTALVLFGLPAWVLARFTVAPPAVLVAVTSMGLGIAVILEGIAHIYGLWYSLGITELKLFGVLPLETVAALTLQILFFALVYEVLFDDGVYTERSAEMRFGFFTLFAIASLGLIAIHVFLVRGVFLDYSYLWLVMSMVVASFVMLSLHRRFSVVFINRIFNFALIAALPSGLALWLAAHNVHKVFGNQSAYIASVPVFGQVVPIEALAVLFVLPLFVATMYEIYLDDEA